MAGTENVFILDGARTPMAEYNGAFAEVSAIDLGVHAAAEAMRRSGVGRIAYASGSGVYGDLGEHEADEDHGPLVPVSTYGASKLAGEALISAYAHMFDMQGVSFRFGNVVGPNQTHGVGFDFVRKLLADPTRLEILGDGFAPAEYRRHLATTVVGRALERVRKAPAL